MKLNVNNSPRDVDDDYREDPLLWTLRDELGLSGTHYGCGIGQCGSCMVLVDDVATRSCQTPTQVVEGSSIVTIEGLASLGADGVISELHAVQQGFMEFPLQCMWCLPGHVMVGVQLLATNPSPSTEDIEAAIADNLCRCGGYGQIRKALARAAELQAGAK
jgi:aerobic-type carbon monoxide dehydrogenase small subunit (CoxS/CutS family)